MKKKSITRGGSPFVLTGAVLLFAACSPGNEPEALRGAFNEGSVGSESPNERSERSVGPESPANSGSPGMVETDLDQEKSAKLPQTELAAPSSLHDVIVTLADMPSQLGALPLEDDRWRAWFQQRMGTSVELTGVRSLGATSDLEKIFKRPILLSFKRTKRENINQAVEHARSEGVLRSVDFDFFRGADDASDGEGLCRCEEDPTSGSVCLPDGVRPGECACDQDGSCSVDCGCDAECGTIPGPDPLRSEQWYLDSLNVEEAWQVTKGSPDVVVAVIDSGVDLYHPDWRTSDGRESIFWTNPDEIPCDGEDNDDPGGEYPDDIFGWDFVDLDREHVEDGDDAGPEDNDPNDYGGHGTKMIGYIAAQHDNGVGIAGVAPGVTIMPLRALAERTGTTDEDVGESIDRALVQAVFYAVDRGADIISMSLGDGTPSEAVHDAVRYAWNSGTLVVASAGNGGDYTRNYPGSSPTVVSVTGLNQAGEHDAATDFHESVDIAAPGTPTGMLTTQAGGTWSATGRTSAATALTAGVAALIKSAFPGLSVSELRSKLLGSVTPWEDAADPLARQWYGMGRLDAGRAVRSGNRPRARIVFLDKREYGDGDHHIESGERVRIDAAWHVSGLDHDVVPRIIPQNNHIVSVETDLIETDNTDDPILTARFLVQFDDVISGEIAEMNLELADSDGAILSTEVRVPVGMRMRSYGQLPASSRRHFVDIGNGKSMFIFDRHDAAESDRVFASVFDGEFGHPFVVSQEGNNTFRPEVVRLPDGDVGVAYLRKNTYKFWAYRRYDVSSAQWLPIETPFERIISAGNDDGRLGLGVDSQGREIVVWSSDGAIRSARRELDGQWSFQDLVGGAEAVVRPEATIRSSDGGLRLFIHSALDKTTTYVSEYDGEEWGPLVAVDEYPEGGATVPYTWQSFTQRVFAPTPGAPLVEGRFIPHSGGGGHWITGGWLDVDGLILGSQIGMTTTADGRYAFFLQPAGNQAGKLLELDGGAAEIYTLQPDPVFHLEGPSLQYEAPLDLERPRIVVDQNDDYHAFSRQEITSDLKVDRYWSEVELDWGAQPSVPSVWIVDGDVLEDPRSVRAGWYAYDPVEVESYMVAVGTYPGGADLREWRETIYRTSTFSLKTSAVPPGRRVYVSVIPKTEGVLSASMGVSAGAIWPRSDQQ